MLFLKKIFKISNISKNASEFILFISKATVDFPCLASYRHLGQLER